MTASETRSKFKIKGTAILGLKVYFDEKTNERSFLEIYRQTLPDAGELILASSWYDAEEQKMVMEACANHLAIDMDTFSQEVTRASLISDLNGVYKFFMKLGGATRVLSSAPQMAKAYTNYNKYDLIRNEKGYHEASVTVPKQFTDWNLNINRGSLTGVLEVCGHAIKEFEVIDRRTFNDHEIEKSTVTFKIIY